MKVHKLTSEFITVYTLFLLLISHYLLNNTVNQHLQVMSSFLLSISYQLLLTLPNSQKTSSF